MSIGALKIRRRFLHLRVDIPTAAALVRDQGEIAKRVGISQMHVSRLLRRALDQVRRQVPRAEDG